MIFFPTAHGVSVCGSRVHCKLLFPLKCSMLTIHSPTVSLFAQSGILI
jgi:hypothetical protein